MTQDWTTGQPGIVIYRCDAGHDPFYFERSFCPTCGSLRITAIQSPGIGTVIACTLLHRAPTPELRSHAPYLIALVALDEEVTVMGHADRATAIGDRVRADFIAFGDQPAVPFFLPLGGQDD